LKEKTYSQIIEEEMAFSNMEETGSGKAEKNRYKAKMREQEYQRRFQQIEDSLLAEEVRVPDIMYLVNKCEDEYESDVLEEFHKIAGDDPNLEPLFISAEHGDGLVRFHC